MSYFAPDKAHLRSSACACTVRSSCFSCFEQERFIAGAVLSGEGALARSGSQQHGRALARSSCLLSLGVEQLLWASAPPNFSLPFWVITAHVLCFQTRCGTYLNVPLSHSDSKQHGHARLASACQITIYFVGNKRSSRHLGHDNRCC